MSKSINGVMKYVRSNSKIAKILSVIYFVWLLVILNVIVNTYSGSNHSVSSKTNWTILAFSIVGSLIPVFISTLHEGIYGVQFFGGGKKRRQGYIDKMDERQLQIRRQVFERSYAILATLAVFAVFVGTDWYGNNLSQDGSFAFGYNILMLVIGLPSIVAVWDKMANVPISD